MSLPHLHLFHPGILAAPHLPEWIAAVEVVLRGEANWDGCELHRLVFDDQAGFDVPTSVDLVNRNRGPVIVVQKVQAGILARFRAMIQRRVSVYPIAPSCDTDIWSACEVAKAAYEDGEPRIPSRELIAYLIVRKLERLGKWGGTALNKNFLWAEDLPKGGFPKPHNDRRLILQVADALLNVNILVRKESEGEWKYALGEKNLVQPILDTRAFEGWNKLQNYFNNSATLVPADLLDFKEDST